MSLYSYIYFLVAAAGILTASAESEMPSMDFEEHFKALSTVRHPLVENGRQWREGRDYVRNKMAFFGLGPIIQEQVFNVTVDGVEVQGVNLIGIEEGEDPKGPIIVVGADYATARKVNPLKDNTGGVACLLETIHLYHDRVAYNNHFKNFTVIFVAFDLNTNELQGSGMSDAGSKVFVHEWLLPYLNQTEPAREYRGAIILDSVTTFNHNNETQILPSGFDEVFPSAYATITKRGTKGDFIGFLYKAMDAKNDIRVIYNRMYNRDRKLRPFRLQEMETHFSLQNFEDNILSMIDHQAIIHFWTMDMPAFLLFDTDEFRKDPDPESSTCEKCDVEEFLTQPRIEFMEHTTYTLVFTLLELQTSIVDAPSAASTPVGFHLLLIITLIAAVLKV